MALTFGGGNSPFDVANPYQAPPGIGDLAGAFSGQPAGGLPNNFPGTSDYQRSLADPFWKYKQVISGQDKLPIMVNLPGPGGASTPLAGGPGAGGRTIDMPGAVPTQGRQPWRDPFLPESELSKAIDRGGFSGGGGGGGGGIRPVGGGGGGGSSSFENRVTSRQLTPEAKAELEYYRGQRNRAQQGVENRYQQMLGIAGKTTGQREADIRRAYGEESANIMQRLARLGMANTTIAPTLQAGVSRERESALNRLADELQKTQLGIIQGRPTEYPTTDLLQVLAGYAPSSQTTATTTFGT